MVAASASVVINEDAEVWPFFQFYYVVHFIYLDHGNGREKSLWTAIRDPYRVHDYTRYQYHYLADKEGLDDDNDSHTFLSNPKRLRR